MASPKTKTNENDFFLGVKTHFEEYERFRAGKKTTEDEAVELVSYSPQKAHEGSSEISSEITVGDCFFRAVISPRAMLKYELQIFCRFYGQPPCLRFDSRGHYHKNKEDGSGLPALRVRPPHFHKVDRDGWLRAYHTVELADPQSAEAISKELARGVELFCQEFNLSTPSAKVVSLKQLPRVLPAPAQGAMDHANFPKT